MTKVMSLFFTWIVTGTSTVSPVTFTKSVRTSNGIRLTLILWLTTSSRSLNLTFGGDCILASMLQLVEFLAVLQ